MSGKASSRRFSALSNVALKKGQQAAALPVNLQALVRVYFLDGSSKVLQMTEASNVHDLLVALKFNLFIQDISTHALFRVIGSNIRRLELNETVQDILRDPTGAGIEVRILFRSWIVFKNGCFEWEAFQPAKRLKQSNTALWLAYTEAIFMCMMDKYYLTEDEAIMLGCLRMQAESGDFNPKIHNLDVIKERVTSRFPNPVREKLKTLTSANATDLCSRVQGAYARLAGKLKAESQINYLECLRTWCPFYGSTFFDVQCQYDENPLDASSSPPVLPMSAAIGPLALFLIVSNNSSTKSSTSTASISSSTTMIRHPYHRIVKWVCHADKHIFTYWIIKATTSLDAVDEAQRQYQAEQEKEGNFDAGGFDVRPFCDCVYLVCPQVRELEYLVKSYVHILRPGLNRLTSAPSLPGASGELLPVPLSPSVLLEDGEEGEEINSSISGSGDAYFPSSGGDNDREKETEKVTRRRSMLGALLGIGTASPETQEAPSKSTLKSSGSGLELNNNGSSSSDSGPPLQSAAPPVEDATKTKSLFRSIYGSGNSNSSSSGNRKTAKKKKSVNFSDKVDVSATPPPVPTAAGEEEADSDIEPPDEEEDDGGDDSDEGGAEGGGAQNMTVKFAAGISDVQNSPLRDWSEVDDLDSDDDGPPVSNAVYKKKSTLPDGSVGAPPPPPPPPQRRSSVDAIRRASTAIFGTFRAKASDKSDPTSGGAVSDPEETKQQSSEEQKKKLHSEASEL